MKQITSALIVSFLLLSLNITAQEKENIPGQPIAKDKKGLLFGSYNPDEPVAKTKAESALSLKPRPGRNQEKPFYLFIPSNYNKDKAMPLVIVLHRRGNTKGFNSKHKFKIKDLTKYTNKELEAWKDIAEKNGFILALPLADAESLWIGVSWFTNDRTKFIASQIEEIQKTHNIDNSRVYLVGMNEGAHAILSTTIRQGGIIAAAAICNPPLFDGNSALVKGERLKKTVMPETIDEMIKVAHKRKAGLLILAGKSDNKLKINHHAIGGGRGQGSLIRYEDSSKIPLAHMKKMAQLLQKSGHKNQFVAIEGTHYSPIPNNEIKKIWDFLSKHKIPKTEQESAAIVNKKVQDILDAERKAKRDANAKLIATYQAAQKAHKEKKYKEAINGYNELLPKVRNKIMIYYSLARSQAKLELKDEALTSLKNSVISGYADIETMKAEPDFKNIKNDLRFEKAIKLSEKMSEYKRKQMEYIRNLMKKHKNLKVDIQ